MSERVRVAPERELTEGDRRIVETPRGQVGVFNIDGEYYAISNVCAHRSGPLCEGKVQGTLRAEHQGPGKRVKEYFTDEPAIACPLHGWEYDLATGEHLGDDRIRIPTYDVLVEDGVIYVEV